MLLNASKIKIDDVYTNEWGIKPKGRIEVPTPEQDTEHIEIRGRHGSLTKKYGYKDIPLPVTFTMHGDPFNKIFREAKMNLIFGKTMLLEEDSNVYYKIKKVEIDPAESLMKTFGEFTVNFTLAPFQYEVENEPITINNSQTINNPGYESEPIIEVTCNGTGKIYINNQEVQIKDINGNITVNSEMQNAYRIQSGSTENLNSHMVGDFPVLENGENEISFDGDIEKLKITKNARWI